MVEQAEVTDKSRDEEQDEESEEDRIRRRILGVVGNFISKTFGSFRTTYRNSSYHGKALADPIHPPPQRQLAHSDLSCAYFGSAHGHK